MDTRKNKNVIALSIFPKYAHAILCGEKTVEFRRNGMPTNITHIVVYSTSPDQMILGYCEVTKCIEDSPAKLWENYGEYGVISKKDFFSYYEGYEKGKCYLIEKPRSFKRPITLEKCKSFSKSPQSFVYVTINEWKNLKRKKTANRVAGGI